MPMRARTTDFQRFLAAFLLTTLAAVAVVLALSARTPLAATEVPPSLAAACILVGLIWVLVGYVLTPTVETYLGQGAMKGVPIIGPSFANPQRSRPVLADLAWKLSVQTDAGILVAVLGFALMTAGFLFYLAPGVGLLILAALLVVVAAVLVLTWFGRPSAGSATHS